MAQPTSDTYAYNPSASDVVLDAYSRIQVRPTSITSDHMFQARLSANSVMIEFSVKGGPNLWEISLITIPLQQGVITYNVPQNVVAIYDMYVRQYQVGNPVDQAPDFTTTLNSTTVTVGYPNHGLSVGQWMEIVVPVAIGGIVLQGFYQAVTVPDQNTLTITATSAATSAATGGAVPAFTTAIGSDAVTVTLANHGYTAGQSFSVQISTTVGGLTLSGAYTVLAYVSASQFTIQANASATSVETVSENGGDCQLEAQVQSSIPNDRVITPISRTEYSAQPQKTTQAYPSTAWWNRQIASAMYMWPVPDGNGPYTLNLYAMTQVQDVTIPAGATLDIPYRFLEAFTASLAAKLAQKYPPPPPNSLEKLDQLAERSWAWASQQDSEDVPLFIFPGLNGYYR